MQPSKLTVMYHNWGPGGQGAAEGHIAALRKAEDFFLKTRVYFELTLGLHSYKFSCTNLGFETLDLTL
jgi:hypothetical protein